MVVDRYTHVDWTIVEDLEENEERGEGGFGSTGQE